MTRKCHNKFSSFMIKVCGNASITNIIELDNTKQKWMSPNWVWGESLSS